MRRWLTTALVAILVLPAVVAGLVQEFTVRITVGRANVRSGPSLSSEVVTQLTGGTVLLLRRIEGEWFRVALPPDPALGGALIEAYVSNTVAVVEAVTASPPPAAPAPAPAAEPPEASASGTPAAPESLVPRRDGMAVALQIGVSTAWLTPEPTTLTRFDAEVRSVPELARALAGLPAGGGAMGGTVTFAWSVARPTAGQIVPDQRPSFVATFQEIPGVRAEDVEPFLVRLSPVGTVGRAVAAVRASRSRIDDRDMSWNVMRDLRQDEVRVSKQPVARGAVRLQPSDPLPPGEYAIVLRPRDGWRLAGASLLTSAAEGHLFAWAWGFSVRPDSAP